jgi:hypothetical protein
VNTTLSVLVWALKTAAILLLALLVTFAAYMVEWTLRTQRPDYLLDDVDRYMAHHFLWNAAESDGWINLVPDLFAKGASRSEVESRLREAGYWSLRELPVDGGVSHRFLDAFACGGVAEIMLYFDKGDHLTHAAALAYSGPDCND